MNYFPSKYIKDLPLTESAKDAISKIDSFMPEINRGVTHIGRRNSQTALSLMTLNMLDSGPYRVLAQILSQINKTYSNVRYALFKLRRLDLEIKELKNKEVITELDILKIEKKQFTIDYTIPAILNSIKEIGALQQRYREVIENNGVPEKWTEKDFEEAEIAHHIKSIFRNAIRDRLAGNHNVGTMEYMEQFGIEPITAYALVDNFILNCYDFMKNGRGDEELLDIQGRYNFYDAMYEQFKNEYVKAMDRIGLNSILYSEWLMGGRL